MQNQYLPEGLLLTTAQNREAIASQAGLERAMAQGRILEAPAALCDSDMNLYVDLGNVRGYMPREEVAYCRAGEEVKQIAVITRVGKPVCFKVIGMREERGMPTAILSRRAAQLECRTAFLADLIPGDIIRAKVTHLEQFGAFVDIGCGIPSLLTVDCISVSRISHPADRFTVGEYIPVVIRSIDRENDRIFVTHRELLGTWAQNAALFSVGETVRGVVRSIEPYGVFIELTPNLSGLAEPRADLRPGMAVSVYIKSILPQRMKVKLTVIDVLAPYDAPTPPRYFITDGHIDEWVYTPACCDKKIVKTIFG